MKMIYETPQITNTILLDSNIIDYAVKTKTSIAFGKVIIELSRKNYILKISKYSKFELTRGANSRQQREILEVYSQYKSIEVSDDVLTTASWLDTLYGIEKITSDKISDGDKIIASTVILERATLLTANGRDFPWPFFKEIDKKSIIFKVKNRSRCIFLTHLVPDYEAIQLIASQRI